MSKVRVACNNVFRLSFGYRRSCSTSEMSVTNNTCLSKVQTKVCAGTQHHASKLVYMLLPKRVTQIYQNEAQAWMQPHSRILFWKLVRVFTCPLICLNWAIYSTTLILASLTFDHFRVGNKHIRVTYCIAPIQLFGCRLRRLRLTRSQSQVADGVPWA